MHLFIYLYEQMFAVVFTVIFTTSSSQIKCSKLRSYLKEICESEVRAKMRNLELLSDVECIENDMKEYSSDHGPLQQQKV